MSDPTPAAPKRELSPYLTSLLAQVYREVQAARDARGETPKPRPAKAG